MASIGVSRHPREAGIRTGTGRVMLDTADVGWEGRLANAMPCAHAAAATSARAFTDGASVFDAAEDGGGEYCAALMLLRFLHER